MCRKLFPISPHTYTQGSPTMWAPPTYTQGSPTASPADCPPQQSLLQALKRRPSEKDCYYLHSRDGQGRGKFLFHRAGQGKSKTLQGGEGI